MSVGVIARAGYQRIASACCLALMCIAVVRQVEVGALRERVVEVQEGTLRVAVAGLLNGAELLACAQFRPAPCDEGTMLLARLKILEYADAIEEVLQ